MLMVMAGLYAPADSPAECLPKSVAALRPAAPTRKLLRKPAIQPLVYLDRIMTFQPLLESAVPSYAAYGE